MRDARTIADLLTPEPPQWGLRGDPHLWRELRATLATTPLPATEAEPVALLETTYLQLVGAPLTASEPTIVISRSTRMRSGVPGSATTQPARARFAPAPRRYQQHLPAARRR